MENNYKTNTVKGWRKAAIVGGLVGALTACGGCLDPKLWDLDKAEFDYANWSPLESPGRDIVPEVLKTSEYPTTQSNKEDGCQEYTPN